MTWSLGHLVVTLCDMQAIRVRLPEGRFPVDENGLPLAVTFQVDDVTTWVPALRYDHTQPFRRVAFHIAQTGSARAGTSHDAWTVAILQEELMRAVAEILSDGFICGFTKEAITHPAGTEFHKEILLVSYNFRLPSPGP